jgi:hypothetical protein
MNELEFAYKVKNQLDHGAEALDRKTAERLHAARERALAQRNLVSSPLSFAGLGGLGHAVWSPRVRSAAAVLALAFSVIGWNYWSDLQQVDELEEVDTALLSDELPLNAYLDRGFHAWLEQSSQQ